MKINKLLIVVVLAVALLGCGKRETRHIVILPDVSGSIDEKSRDQAFKAIERLASHLRRGDELTIIPIAGDAEAEAPGSIIRFRVPPNRAAYDADLQQFAIQLRKTLEQLTLSAVRHPGAKTDILGSVTLASHEIRSIPGAPTLMILSDFIQDDGENKFLNDYRLSNSTAANEFAKTQAKKQALDLNGVSVYLGLLKSSEYAGCSHNRRAAIQTFWLQYFKNLKSRPEFAADGLGLLEQAISGFCMNFRGSFVLATANSCTLFPWASIACKGCLSIL